MTGTIKWFDAAKGYGFIKRDDGEGDVFLHCKEVALAFRATVKEGDRVEFDLEERGRNHPAAVKVKF